MIILITKDFNMPTLRRSELSTDSANAINNALREQKGISGTCVKVFLGTITFFTGVTAMMLYGCGRIGKGAPVPLSIPIVLAAIGLLSLIILIAMICVSIKVQNMTENAKNFTTEHVLGRGHGLFKKFQYMYMGDTYNITIAFDYENNPKTIYIGDLNSSQCVTHNIRANDGRAEIRFHNVEGKEVFLYQEDITGKIPGNSKYIWETELTPILQDRDQKTSKIGNFFRKCAEKIAETDVGIELTQTQVNEIRRQIVHSTETI